jgi:hypothetical protein
MSSMERLRDLREAAATQQHRRSQTTALLQLNPWASSLRPMLMFLSLPLLRTLLQLQVLEVERGEAQSGCIGQDL